MCSAKKIVACNNLLGIERLSIPSSMVGEAEEFKLNVLCFLGDKEFKLKQYGRHNIIDNCTKITFFVMITTTLLTPTFK